MIRADCIMNTLLNLPEYLTTPFWWKLILLGGFASVVYFILQLLFANITFKRWAYGRWDDDKSRHATCGRDRAIAFSRLWALVITFCMVQLYQIAVVNYNLAEMTQEAMLTLEFYLRLVPELLISLILVVAFIVVRGEVKNSIA